MAQTTKTRVELLLRLPWSIYVDSACEPEDGIVLRVRELPHVLGTGMTGNEAEADFWSAFRLTLTDLLERGDEVPLPGPLAGRLMMKKAMEEHARTNAYASTAKQVRRIEASSAALSPASELQFAVA